MVKLTLKLTGWAALVTLSFGGAVRVVPRRSHD
jgi:hypothetical protein